MRGQQEYDPNWRSSVLDASKDFLKTVKMDQGKAALSENEMLALYGLVKYPEMNDRELASELGFKTSTLTAIKNRLKKGDYYRQLRIPIMERLGSEILAINLIRLAPTTSNEQDEKIIFPLINNTEEIFYGVRESELLLTLGYFSNYTDIQKAMNTLEYQFSINGIKIEESKLILFPLTLSKVIKNFDFSKILVDSFSEDMGITKPEVRLPPLHDIGEELPPSEPIQLTATERTVLKGLIDYPDQPDNKVGDSIGTTRQAIARLKKKFITQDMVRTIRIPNIKKLGFEIMSFTYVSFAPNAPMEKRADSIMMIAETLPLFFWVTASDEAVLIGLHKNFEDFQQIKNQSISHYTKNKYLRSDPSIHLLSVVNIQTMKDHEYLPLVDGVLKDL